MKALATRHPATTFVVLAYAISWAFWVPGVRLFLRQPTPEIEPAPLALALVGSYGPTFAAFILTGLLRGRVGMAELARRYLKWRVGWWWLTLALLIPVAVFFGGYALKLALGAPAVAPHWERLTLASFLARVAIALPFGPMAEEGGWRGYLLPVFQRRWSAFGSSLVVGAVWTLWHFPMFWVPGAALPPTVAPGLGSVGIYLLGVLATSVIATALYNSTAGSLLVAVLYHLAINLWPQMLGWVFVGEATAAWADLRFTAMAANWTVALVLLAVFGARHLSRKERVT